MTDWSLKELWRLQEARRRDRKQATTRRRKQGLAPPPRVDQLLAQIFQKDPEARRKMAEQKAIAAWSRMVGPAAAAASQAVRLRGGRLVVHVQDPLWMQQLGFLKEQLLAGYRREFPALRIREIYFTRFAAPPGV